MNRGDNGVQKTWNQFFTRLGVPTSGGGEVRGQIFRWHCNNWPATLHFLKIPQTRMLNYQTILIFFPSTFCSPNEWLNSPSKTQKLMKNRLTVLSGFQVKLDGKSLATGTVDHQGRFESPCPPSPSTRAALSLLKMLIYTRGKALYL